MTSLIEYASKQRHSVKKILFWSWQCKKLLKWVKTCQSYGQKFTATSFIDHSVCVQ